MGSEESGRPGEAAVYTSSFFALCFFFFDNEVYESYLSISIRFIHT